jgi:hypothetical protein
MEKYSIKSPRVHTIQQLQKTKKKCTFSFAFGDYKFLIKSKRKFIRKIISIRSLFKIYLPIC